MKCQVFGCDREGVYFFIEYTKAGDDINGFWLCEEDCRQMYNDLNLDG